MNSCRHFPEGCVVPGLRLAAGLELAETRLLGSGLGGPSLRSAVPCSGPRPPSYSFAAWRPGRGLGLGAPASQSGERWERVQAFPGDASMGRKTGESKWFGGSLGSHAHLWLSALPSLKGAW